MTYCEEEAMICRCECGKGELRPALLTDYDFSAFAGIPVLLSRVNGLRCTSCEGETLEGDVINDVLERTELSVLDIPRPLKLNEMTFLRKRMRMSQNDLLAAMIDISHPPSPEGTEDMLLLCLSVFHVFFDRLLRPLS
jgi:hypothetical protein